MSEKPLDENAVVSDEATVAEKETKKKSKSESKAKEPKGLAKSFRFDEKKHKEQPWLKEFDGKTFFEIHEIIGSRIG